MATIKFMSLSSGSCGNCYFLGAFDEGRQCKGAVLVDAGVSPRRLKQALSMHGIGPSSIRAMLITHDHYDHIRSLGSYCKHMRQPVWTTAELGRALGFHHVCGEFLQGCRQVMESGWNEIVPGLVQARYFVVPHDAAQTVGYAIVIDGYRFVIMTDIGAMTKEAMDLASQAQTVVIESNYDLQMLRTGPYPKELQDRICTGHGHLSNAECAAAVGAFAHEGLDNVFLCHLSEHNNTPELAHEASRPALPEKVRLMALPRETPSAMFIL